MRPEVSSSRHVHVAIPIILAACVVLLVGVTVNLLGRAVRQDTHIAELESDLKTMTADRDRWLFAPHTCPVLRLLTQPTYATISTECGSPMSFNVNPGAADVAFPSGCRVNFRSECR